MAPGPPTIFVEAQAREPVSGSCFSKAAAGAVAAVSQTSIGTAIAEQAASLVEDSKGYKVSDHVLKYYKTTLV
jgi:hypothetical protein